MIFTTSWDDGYAHDLRIAEMLEKHGATGTFYVCPKAQHEQAMLTPAQIKDLSLRHEIGGHTITHPRLSRIPIEKASHDIRDGKKWLEDVIGNACESFCYPYGDVNHPVRNAAEAAGFTSARTVAGQQFTASDPFLMPTSLHLYPFPWRPKYTRPSHYVDPLGPLRARWKRLNQLNIPMTARRSWQSLARAIFTYALQSNQPFFHLWGHAFELDTYHLWNELDSFLHFVASHQHIQHKTNAQLAAALFPRP